jgi:hypothetical protein
MMGRTFAAYLSASPFTAATAPLRATWSLGLPTVPSGCLDALVCSSAALPLTLLRFSKRLKYELLAEQGGMAMRNLLAAFVLVSLSTLPANAQAWRNCVQGSIGPGGCDSIGPGGGRSIGPGGGLSIGPEGGLSIDRVVVGRLDREVVYRLLRVVA